MLSDQNKKVYICFLPAAFVLPVLMITAASPSRAAEPASSGSGVVVSRQAEAPGPLARKTLVVRSDPKTGKLVRSWVVAPTPIRQAAGTPVRRVENRPPTQINEIVDKTAKAHDVDPLLVHAMIKVESNYNPHAVSRVGAEGLMQLMPGTARDLGVSNSFDPEQNIEAGVRYLKYLKDLYKDDRLALAAYNAGPGAVQKYKWIPPYPETQNYVYQVGKRYGDARAAAARETKTPAPQNVPAATVEEKPPKVESFVDQNGRLHLRTSQ